MAKPLLYLSAAVEDQNQSVVLPWLRQKGQSPDLRSLPHIVLTPGRAEGYFLRSLMVKEGGSLLGIRFWTPSDLRTSLRRQLAPEMKVTTRNELRLLTKALAESREFSSPGMARSIAREPSGFLRAYEALVAAGWNPAQESSPEMEDLISLLHRTLRELERYTQAEAHQKLLHLAESKASGELLLGGVLMVGFNATHWPLWDLLQAAIRCAESAVISLLAPRVFGEKADQLWISSWEEISGTAVQITDTVAEGSSAPFARLIESYERGVSMDASTNNLNFLVGSDLKTYARALTAQVVAFLQEDSCHRLGLIFPQLDAMALTVTEQLQQLGIPLQNGIGYLRPDRFERPSWKAWLALQRESTVSNFLQWIRACETEKAPPFYPEIDLDTRKMAQILEREETETLVDELSVLTARLEESTGSESRAKLAGILKAMVSWPESASLAVWNQMLQVELNRIGWGEAWELLQEHALSWPQAVPLPISRRAYFDWLAEAAESWQRERGPEGNHFYGKVHVLMAAQMTGQTWSHLILAGLNEGTWPRDLENDGFQSTHEGEELNRRAFQLNRSAEVSGAQGQGQDIMGNRRGYALTSLDKQNLAWRDLCLAVESTTEKVCLSAALQAGDRPLLPSDFLGYVYQSVSGQVLEDERFSELAERTEAWMERQSPLLWPAGNKAKEMPVPSIQSTVQAYRARRNVEQSFGPYEFAYAQPPEQPVQMSARDWENALQQPAALWLRKVVGLKEWKKGELNWERTIGKWVHEWLERALSEPDHVVERVKVEADLTRQMNVKLMKKAFPAWWNQVWSYSRALALDLAQALEPHLIHKQVLREFRLPEGVRGALDQEAEPTFELSGKPDLILLEAQAASIFEATVQLQGRAAWVIDYKTGGDDELRLKRLRDGSGWQTVLYGWALRQLGADVVQLSLLKPNSELKNQLLLDDVLADRTLLDSLHILHRKGIFGQRTGGNSEYAFAPDYPIATLFIPNSILRQKWDLLHGAMPAEEGEPL